VSENRTGTTPTPPPGHALLEGKSVLVTAAAGTGIGYATALRAAQEGARVAISDRHERRLGEAAERLAAETGVEPLAIPCDVTVEEQVGAMVDAAVARFDGLDVIVNNAGLGGEQNILEMTDEEWSVVLDVTLNGTFRCTRAALRHMAARGSGIVVNNASVLGWRAQPRQAHYAAAKAGVMALTRCAAMDVADRGVRVNAVAPSIAIHENLAKSAPQELLDRLSAEEAFGRSAKPWEIATTIVFLASDYSAYLTGEVVSVSSQHP
jgi:3-oxoacyl-[acyl-carrier protein] reductase